MEWPKKIKKNKNIRIKVLAKLKENTKNESKSLKINDKKNYKQKTKIEKLSKTEIVKWTTISKSK